MRAGPRAPRALAEPALEAELWPVASQIYEQAERLGVPGDAVEAGRRAVGEVRTARDRVGQASVTATLTWI